MSPWWHAAHSFGSLLANFSWYFRLCDVVVRDCNGIILGFFWREGEERERRVWFHFSSPNSCFIDRERRENSRCFYFVDFLTSSLRCSWCIISNNRSGPLSFSSLPCLRACICKFRKKEKIDGATLNWVKMVGRVLWSFVKIISVNWILLDALIDGMRRRWS